MYHYVEDKEFLRIAQSDSSRRLKKVENLLRDEYEVNSQIFLVGSGGRNMVTQNENQPIDFDYNLNIISCPDWNDAKGIKESVRKAMNRIMQEEGLRDVQDSTSSLTTYSMFFNDDIDSNWSIDLCIVKKNNQGEWERLIHEKTGFTCNDRYFWNTAPSSKEYSEKAKAIKSIPGWWNTVREKYLNIKNLYLTRNDRNHPSFICYIEAVNNVYNEMRQKRII